MGATFLWGIGWGANGWTADPSGDRFLRLDLINQTDLPLEVLTSDGAGNKVTRFITKVKKIAKNGNPLVDAGGTLTLDFGADQLPKKSSKADPKKLNPTYTFKVTFIDTKGNSGSCKMDTLGRWDQEEATLIVTKGKALSLNCVVADIDPLE